MARITRATKRNMSLDDYFKLSHEDRRRFEDVYLGRSQGLQNLKATSSPNSWGEADEQELAKARLLVQQLRDKRTAFRKATDAKKAADLKRTADARKAADARLKKRNGKRNGIQAIPSGVLHGRIGKRFPKTTDQDSTGLQNPSSLCYRNAILQCMMHTPEFYHLLGSVHQNCFKKSNECVVCSLQSLALAYWNSSTNQIERSRNDLNEALKFVFPDEEDIQGEYQADPHEWIWKYVDQIRGNATLSVPDSDPMEPEAIVGTPTRGFTVSSVFDFELTASWICVKCTTKHISVPPIQSSAGLNIILRTDLRGTIEDQLRDTTSSPFFNVAPFECNSPACKAAKAQDVPVPDQTETLLITKAPDILILSLGRFAGGRRKVSHRVAYQENLDLDEFAAADGGRIRYRLNGVVMHKGRNLSSGHYVASVTCRDPAGTYCIVNDNVVGEPSRDESVLLNPQDRGQAYLLVYSKV